MSALLQGLTRHAATAPERLALSGAGRAVDYGTLFREARGIAAALQARGVGRGDLVAVHAEKTPTAVTALLGVLLAGAAYVPLDPSAPAARRRSLVADARPALVLAAAAKAAALADELSEEPGEEPGEAVPVLAAEEATGFPTGGWREPERDPEDLAYVLYTSGSTGRAKGVKIPHRALDTFFAGVADLLDLGPDAVCLNTSALHFDVSVVDLLFPLAQGATVHLGPALALPGVLLDLIERHRITHMAAVGSTLTLLAQHGAGLAGRHLGSLRRIMTGAEVLNPATVQAWLAVNDQVRVINGYGPTEATCLVVAEPITAREPGRTEHYPIGRPLPGTVVSFRTGDGCLDPQGPGEILVSGPQLMAGYLNRPEEERAAFLDLDGVRWYRTGDLGRRAPDGVIRFTGRADDEVKIRGYRINLNEVRGGVESHPQVTQALVLAVADPREGQSLVCAVRLRGDAATDAAGLAAHAASVLPRYMVPRSFVVLPEFPVLPSGKPDAARLRELVEAAR